MHFLFILTFLTGIIMTFEVVKIIKFVFSHDGDIWWILGIFGRLALTVFPITVPMAIFFTSLYSTVQISQTSEYVAMRSFGMSNLNIYSSLLILSLVVSFWIYNMNQEFIPNSQRYLKQTIGKLKSDAFLNELKGGYFFTEVPKLIIFPEEFNKETKRMKNIFIHLNDKSGKKTISAKSGILDLGKDDGSLTDLTLKLKEGNITSLKKESEDSEKIIFKTYDFNFLNKSKFIFKNERPEAMTKNELTYFISLSDSEHKKRKTRKRSIIRAHTEFYHRFNTPIVCLLLPFIGFCLGISNVRSHNNRFSLNVFFVLLSYYISYFALLSMAKKGTMDPKLALAIPSIILVFHCIIYSRRLKWLS